MKGAYSCQHPDGATGKGNGNEVFKSVKEAHNLLLCVTQSAKMLGASPPMVKNAY
jgi:hypothetical protein